MVKRTAPEAMCPSALTTRQVTLYTPGASFGSATRSVLSVEVGKLFGACLGSRPRWIHSAVRRAGSENLISRTAGTALSVLPSAGVELSRRACACASWVIRHAARAPQSFERRFIRFIH